MNDTVQTGQRRGTDGLFVAYCRGNWSKSKKKLVCFAILIPHVLKGFARVPVVFSLADIFDIFRGSALIIGTVFPMTVCEANVPVLGLPRLGPSPGDVKVGRLVALLAHEF